MIQASWNSNDRSISPIVVQTPKRYQAMTGITREYSWEKESRYSKLRKLLTELGNIFNGLGRSLALQHANQKGPSRGGSRPPMGLWWLNACRITTSLTRITPAPPFWFFYGTLPGNVESGKERFLIEMIRRKCLVHILPFPDLGISWPG